MPTFHHSFGARVLGSTVAGGAGKYCGDDQDDAVRAAIEAHLPAILGSEAATVGPVEINLGAPSHARRGRYVRVAELAYSGPHGVRRLTTWLKFFTTEYRPAYDVYQELYEANGQIGLLLPRVYFCLFVEPLKAYMAALEDMPGTRLRENILWSQLTMRRKRLVSELSQFGVRLRAFHEALAGPASYPADDIVARVIRAADTSPVLVETERLTIRNNIHRAADAIGGVRLKLTRTHEDLSLKNIIRSPDGRFVLIDPDTIGGSSAVPWFDFTQFLLSLQGLHKYWPVFGRSLVRRMSTAFVTGYRGAHDPDGLTNDQARALVYLLKLEFFFGTHHRPEKKPLYFHFMDRFGQRFIRQLKAEFLHGSDAVLGFEE